MPARSLLLILTLSLSFILSAQKKFPEAGNWRGVFQLATGVEVPFNFRIVESNGRQTGFLLNGDEKFETGTIDKKDDSVFIRLDPFDNELALGAGDTVLKGSFRKIDGSGIHIPVTLQKDKEFRFAEKGIPPSGDLTGTYAILLNAGTGNEEKAVGLFSQKGNKLSATFLRITGDSRYLEGIVEGDQFYLSSFIGSGPGYYKGSFDGKGHLKGEIIGARGRVSFTGRADESAALPDPMHLTNLKEGYQSLDFSFPDAYGKPVSLKDEKYRNKVVVITITGTWCPNCIDEAYFLAPWFKQNHKRGVEAIAIHYERRTDTAYTRSALERFRRKYNIEYDQVVAGPADKQFVAASLPALNSFLSFPTIILIDKKGNVAQIHTGFSGPATGEHYVEFEKSFNKTITELLEK